MPHRTAWSELRTGIIAIVAVLGAAALIIIFARVGSLHGKTFSLLVLTDEARGVIRGTEVWLDGQKVGLVKDVAFVPPTEGGQSRVVMHLDVLAQAREHIRLDSRARIRSGGSLISSAVVWINTGTPRTRAVREGDTIRSAGQTDYESVTAQVAAAAKELPAIGRDVKEISTDLTNTEGAVGAFTTKAAPELHAMNAKASRIMSEFSSRRGSIGPLLTGSTAVTARARHALAGVDSLRIFLASDRTSFGRFRRDSTLRREVAALMREIASVRALASSPAGTIGRLQSDSALTRSLADVYQQMDSLFADLSKHPLRYIAF